MNNDYILRDDSFFRGDTAVPGSGFYRFRAPLFYIRLMQRNGKQFLSFGLCIYPIFRLEIALPQYSHLPELPARILVVPLHFSHTTLTKLVLLFSLPERITQGNPCFCRVQSRNTPFSKSFSSSESTLNGIFPACLASSSIVTVPSISHMKMEL